MEQQVQKKRIFSGIQPTGNLTLGNYIGALRNFNILQDEYDCLYSIVDLHALTVRQNPAELRKACLRTMAIFLASGLDPEKNIIFFQSQVAAHAELGWILDNFTYMGEMSRMTQFKDKSAKHKDNINAGLFTYPVLMAADILLYQPHYVPVGADQKQHVELTRDIAQRFNSIYGDVFRIPEPYIPKAGARIYGLTTPGDKMSKSIPEGCVFIMDDPATIARKFKRAVTDSDRENCVRFDPENKPGVANLMSIYSSVTGKTYEEIEKEFEGQGYGVFKPAVGEAVIDTLRPIREETERLIKDKAYLEQVYREGAQKASYIANKTLRKVYKKVGFVQI